MWHPKLKHVAAVIAGVADDQGRSVAVFARGGWELQDEDAPHPKRSTAGLGSQLVIMLSEGA